MVTKICQIKGSNGSGKTTIVKQLIHFSSDVKVLTLKSTGEVFATAMDDIGWVAIGDYPEDKKMGGCDKFPRPGTVSLIKDAIRTAMIARPDYWIVFEGMMISTIKSTFYHYLLMLEMSEGIIPLFVILNADVQGCMDRLGDRGTARSNRSKLVENVGSKCELVVRHARTYEPKYVRWLDVENIPVDRMALEFIKAVDDVTLEDELSLCPLQMR